MAGILSAVFFCPVDSCWLLAHRSPPDNYRDIGGEGGLVNGI